MSHEYTDIYSDIFQTLGLDPSQGGARFLKLLSIWVGVAGLTTFMVFQWSISNLALETGKFSYNKAVSFNSPTVAPKMLNRPPAGSKNFRLMKPGSAADKTKVINDPSRQKKQVVWIYNNGHLTSIPMTTGVINDTPGLGSNLFQARPWQGRLHTIMEATLL